MGVAGWKTIGENVRLEGIVVDHWYNGGTTGDNDWSLKIKADPAYVPVAINSNNKANSGNLVECEIRTPIDDAASESNVFGPLMGKRVTVWGTWVEDISHDRKTEIHPLMALLFEDQVVGFVKRITVMAFSDQSPRVMLIPPRPSPPHARQPTHAQVGVAYPPAHDDDLPAKADIVNEKNLTSSRSFYTNSQNGQPVLTADILTGSGGGKGYYRGVLDLSYDTSSTPYCTGVLHQWGGAAYCTLNMEANTFLTDCIKKFGLGVPITRIRTYVQNGQRLWAGVYHQPNIPTMLRWYLTGDAFNKLFGENYATMCLIDATTYVENGQRLWAGIWQNSKDSNGYTFGSSPSDLTAQALKWGIPLISMRTYLDGGQRVWFGIYRGTGVKTELSSNLTFDQVLAQLGKYNGKRKLICIEPYINNYGQRVWACLWQLTPSGNVLSYWVNANLFAQNVQKLFNESGWSITDVVLSRGR